MDLDGSVVIIDRDKAYKLQADVLSIHTCTGVGVGFAMLNNEGLS